MNREIWFKIGSGILAFLISLALWFAQMELSDIKANLKAIGKSQDKLSERMAHLEGFHEAERCYRDGKGK